MGADSKNLVEIADRFCGRIGSRDAGVSRAAVQNSGRSRCGLRLEDCQDGINARPIEGDLQNGTKTTRCDNCLFQGHGLTDVN